MTTTTRVALPTRGRVGATTGTRDLLLRVVVMATLVTALQAAPLQNAPPTWVPRRRTT